MESPIKNKKNLLLKILLPICYLLVVVFVPFLVIKYFKTFSPPSVYDQLKSNLKIESQKLVDDKEAEKSSKQIGADLSAVYSTQKDYITSHKANVPHEQLETITKKYVAVLRSLVQSRNALASKTVAAENTVNEIGRHMIDIDQQRVLAEKNEFIEIVIPAHDLYVDKYEKQVTEANEIIVPIIEAANQAVENRMVAGANFKDASEYHAAIDEEFAKAAAASLRKLYH